MKDYTIQAIYTLSDDGTPKLVDHYWERYQGFLYKPFVWNGEEEYKDIYICSYEPHGVYDKHIKLSTINESLGNDANGLFLEEQYYYDESITGKALPYYGADGAPYDSLHDTHYFYANMELERPIDKFHYRNAFEKYVTTEQTKRVGLELKSVF